MSCHRCRTTTCPGCPVEVDCVRCGTPTDLDHTDDRGRCAGCVEDLIAAALAEAVDDDSHDVADATVSPEVIRVAVEVARADAEEATRAKIGKLLRVMALDFDARARCVETPWVEGLRADAARDALRTAAEKVSP